jgi:hypothetical protein
MTRFAPIRISLFHLLQSKRNSATRYMLKSPKLA